MRQYIHGLHEPGGEHLMVTNPGFLLFTHELGRDPGNHNGFDYTPWTSQGFQVIARLNHGYGAAGTIPLPAYYADFAQRVQNFAANSVGCYRWIIGNEPNHSQERPEGQPIRPAQYAECFNMCADGILSIGGYWDDIVIPAPVAVWNVETTYPENPSGDWIKYFTDQLAGCDEALVGGIALHTYTHGSDPLLIVSEQTMDPPYQDRRYHFRAYRDFMAVVPDHLASRPVYITETNQNGPWLNQNNGWIQAAMAEVDGWNQVNDQVIEACICYRWPRYDQWYMDGLGGVMQGFQEAADLGYYVEVNGDGTMPDEEWVRIYLNECTNFYDQDGVPEQTIPVGTRLHYRHRLEGQPPGYFPRPELDLKDQDLGHTEYHSPPRAASGLYISAEGQFAWVTDRIPVTPGKKLRAIIKYMHIFHEGGQNGGGGAQPGIVMGDGPFGGENYIWPVNEDSPFDDPNIVYGPWRSSRIGASDYLQDRGWADLVVDDVQHGVNFVRLIVRCHSDVQSSCVFHIDDLELFMLTDDDPGLPPDPPAGGGECDPISSGVADLALVMAKSLLLFSDTAKEAAKLFHNLVDEWMPDASPSFLQRVTRFFTRKG